MANDVFKYYEYTTCRGEETTAKFNIPALAIAFILTLLKDTDKKHDDDIDEALEEWCDMVSEAPENLIKADYGPRKGKLVKQAGPGFDIWTEYGHNRRSVGLIAKALHTKGFYVGEWEEGSFYISTPKAEPKAQRALMKIEAGHAADCLDLGF